MDCKGSLCNKCRDDHAKSKLTKDHAVLPINDPQVIKFQKSAKIRCKKHSAKFYILFCNPCQMPCCLDCMTEHHLGELDKISPSES